MALSVFALDSLKAEANTAHNEAESAIATTEEIRICGVEWPPFTTRSESGAMSGISYEMLKTAFSRMGVSFQLDFVPWERCKQMVINGVVFDAILDATENADLIVGENPTSMYPIALFKRPSPSVEVDAFDWSVGENKSVGRVLGYAYNSFEEKMTAWNFDYSTDDRTMIQKLALFRTDFIIGDMFSTHILAEEMDLDIKMLQPFMSVDNLYLAFNPQHQAIQSQFDRVVAGMIDDGTLDRIYQQSIGYTYAELMSELR